MRPRGTHAEDPIRFEFKEVAAGAVRPEVTRRYPPDLLRFCERDNARP